MDVQQVADKVINMIGPEGVFSILGAILLVRVIRSQFYWDKQEAFIASIFLSGLVGAGTAFFLSDAATAREIGRGAFITVIGSIITFELLKVGLAIAYQKFKWEVFRVLFFFLTPRPIKTKQAGKEVKVPPHPTLTQFFDRTLTNGKD